MASLRFVANDILTSLKQMNDDAEITLMQCIYWILVYGDRLKSQHLAKIDSGYFLHEFRDVPVLKESVTGRKYIKLPSGIYDYDLDQGINYISYNIDVDSCKPTFTSIQFARTIPSKTRVLYFSDDEMPTPANPYFYRINGEYVYFLGIERVDVKYVDMGLFTTFNPAIPPDIDAEWNFPQELIPILQRQVLDLGRFVMLIPQDRINDANQDFGSEKVPTNKIISVNEQPQQQVQQ